VIALFEKIFDKITSKVDEIISIAVWGIDGLELESNVLVDNTIEYELYGAQSADIIKTAYTTNNKILDVLIRITYENKILILLPINEDFFYLVFAEDSVLLSKLEFYLNLYKKEILNTIY